MLVFKSCLVEGLELALEGVCDCKLMCENDTNACKILIQRMADGALPKVPICPAVLRSTKID